MRRHLLSLVAVVSFVAPAFAQSAASTSDTIPAATPTIVLREPPSGSTHCTTLDQANRIDVPDGLAAWLQTPQVLSRDEARRRTIIHLLGFLDGPSCLSGPSFTVADIDVDKSLFIHDRQTLDAGDFTLHRTLHQLAIQAIAAGAGGTTANLIFQRLWDTHNHSPGLVAGGAQCDDDGGQLNGFPLNCPRREGAQASNPELMVLYRPIALVNRLDLAHEGWRNCGEYRIIYGRQRQRSGSSDVTGSEGPFTSDRAFIIFEAVLPNPRPGCRSGCKPVAEFWASLSGLNASTRAAQLEMFFYLGLPGFRPVVHIDHYTGLGASSAYGSSGSGQIRTNERFDSDQWSLREFHLALTCGLPCTSPAVLDVVPTMTKVNPFGWLWNQEVATGAAAPSMNQYGTRAAAFQAEALAQVSSLGQDDINKFGYAVSLDFDAAESSPTPGDVADSYVFTFDNPFSGGTISAGLFHSNLTTAAAGLTPPLSGDQLVRRALAVSCAGCHNPAIFGLTVANALGPAGSNVTSFPPSLALSPGVVFTPGFVHTSEVENSAGIHEISPALQNYFLPARRQFLVDQLNAPTCPCVRTFRFLSTLRQRRAVAIERGVLEDFGPRITERREARLQRLRTKDAELADLIRRRQEIAELEAQQDSATVFRLGKAGIRVAPVTVDQRAQLMKLDLRKAGGDAKRRRLVVTRAVLNALKSEPPRRTVTGH